MDKEKQLKYLLGFVDEQLANGQVLRFVDVINYARQDPLYQGLKRADIVRALRLHPVFAFNSSQQQDPLRSRKYRPIVTNTLGSYHADIGFFGLSKHYATPVSYRAGFLVMKDVLSRFVIAVPLIKDRTAKSIVRALEQCYKKHRAQFGQEHPIISVSFDRETSVMSKQVQAWFAKHSIAFHAFSNSASKAKFAEGAIRLIRTEVDRLRRHQLLTNPANPRLQWWRLLQEAVDSLNAKPIVVQGKKFSYAPRDLVPSNVAAFVRELKKSVPAYFFSQFDISPDLVDFKFQVGDLVRVKVRAVTSQLVGVKTSEQSLGDEIFSIEKRHAYVTTGANKIGICYSVVSLTNGSSDVLDQDEIALAKSYD